MRKKKKTPPDVLEKRNYRKDIRTIFRNCGFTKIPSVSDKEFTFEGKTGDLDDIFIYKNIVVLAEYTCSGTKHQKLSDHLYKKKIIFDIINKNKQEFIKFLENKFEEFKKSREQKYSHSQIHLIILYCSKNRLERRYKEHLPYVKFFDYPIMQYFLRISKIIKKSCRFEIFNFIGLNYNEIASILNVNPGYVSKEKALLKKKNG